MVEEEGGDDLLIKIQGALISWQDPSNVTEKEVKEIGKRLGAKQGIGSFSERLSKKSIAFLA